MKSGGNDFATFEHAGWERVAQKYDSVWSSLTRQFIPHLISAAEVSPGMSVLDVACGPGYVSAAAKQLGAVPTGIDFSENMVAIAKQMLPDVPFVQGDAQNLPFRDGSFDRVLINFGLLHVSHPETACAETCRVLKSGGRLGFAVWAGPEKNPGAKIVNDAIEAHAELDVGLPEGPPRYLYGERRVPKRVGRSRLRWQLNELSDAHGGMAPSHGLILFRSRTRRWGSHDWPFGTPVPTKIGSDSHRD